MKIVRPLLWCVLCLLSSAAVAFDVSAKSAVILDAVTGKVLWSKDANAERYPASTTKIMTAMLLIEHCTPEEVVTAPADIEKVGESSMHLKPGEKLTVKDLLYAILLRSANDGAYAAAIHVSGSVDKFSELMNARAKQLGCQHTHFHNPNGLNDKEHYTSALDLALIAREAMKYPLFREIVHTWKKQIARSINQKDTVMVSRNKWLKKDITADGIKTGYTIPAGHCYVGSATRDGFRVITVLLKSDRWQQDHQTMLDFAFKNYEHQKLRSAGDVLGDSKVAGGQLDHVPALFGTDVEVVLPRNGSLDDFRIQPEFGSVQAPIREGQQIGKARVEDSDGWTMEVPLLAGKSVDKAIPLARTPSNLAYMLFVGTIGGGAFYLKGRARRSGFYGKSRAKRIRI